MSDYEFLEATNVPAFLDAHPSLAGVVPPTANLDIDEIGDGNLNLVFRVRGGGRSLILKQALPYVRMTGEGWPMTPERAAREAFSLRRHGEVAGEIMVRVLAYDPSRYVIAMEDLSDHRVWRDALNEGLSHGGVADRLGRYVAAVAIRTSVLGADRTTVSGEIARTQNPDLCIITEDLVFTEPVVDIGRNVVVPGTEAAAAALAADNAFAAAMAEAKWRFMTHAEALIHGDLHTGSVMVRGSDGGTADSVKVFDSEFACYGPVAFDLGLLLANFGFAAARAAALEETARAAWILDQATNTLEAFVGEFRTLAADAITDALWRERFVAERTAAIVRETWLFAAAELARRVVGAARVSDLETLEPDARAAAITSVITAARALAGGWEEPHDHAWFAGTVGAVIGASRTRYPSSAGEKK